MTCFSIWFETVSQCSPAYLEFSQFSCLSVLSAGLIGLYLDKHQPVCFLKDTNPLPRKEMASPGFVSGWAGCVQFLDHWAAQPVLCK